MAQAGSHAEQAGAGCALPEGEGALAQPHKLHRGGQPFDLRQLQAGSLVQAGGHAVFGEQQVLDAVMQVGIRWRIMRTMGLSPSGPGARSGARWHAVSCLPP